MNISGGGILKNSPNPENAKKLLEFLLTKEAQQHIVNNTFEYPMIDGVEPHPLIKKMGENFKQDLKTKVGDYKKKSGWCIRGNVDVWLEIKEVNTKYFWYKVYYPT